MASELPTLPQNLGSALVEVVGAFDARNVRYALIGGVATGYRSRPRFTQDLDFLADIPQVVLPGLLGDLQQRGFDCDADETIRQWVQEHMTELQFQSVRIDWLKPVLPLFLYVLDSARPEPMLDRPIRIAVPEGLILTKLLAFRSQDQVDIEGLLAANVGQLDLELIRSEWGTVAAADDPRMRRFDELVARFYQPNPGEGQSEK
jgi:hypothetical protein